MSERAHTPADVGFIAIGRNEGERLQAALKAIKNFCSDSPVVYVDSGSTDDSVAFAQSLGIDVVELDMSIPFTAARARNAGFEQLINQHPTLEYVQFFDGDCEMIEGWIEQAITVLDAEENIAIVSGRRMEKFPKASIYNTLMDIEWNTPIGDIKAVLGDMCVRVTAFNEVEGFCENIISAEDDDFCIRIRQHGYRVVRIDANMSRHDANIMTASQWYKRSQRGGHGYANIYHLHGQGEDRYFLKELKSVTFWGGFIPSLYFILLFTAPLLAIALLTVYSVFIAKTALRRILNGDSIKVGLVYAALIYTGKIPEFFGAVQYWKNRLLSRNHQLIEYK